MKKCDLFKKLPDKKVLCLACNQKCIISSEQTGICRVRKNINGELFLTVYGKVASVGIDPIEKKPLYHFLPGTYAFSIGTIGCNMRCSWCQNWAIVHPEESGVSQSPLSPAEVIKQAKANDCKSIAYTYNEPAIFAEFVKDCSFLAKKAKLKNIWVTNGYFSRECLDYFTKGKLIDAMNIDLKSFNKQTYQKYCGAKLELVLDAIKRAHKAGIHIEITTLVIPGLNDKPTELRKIAKFIHSLSPSMPWHVSRFFPQYKMTDKNPTDIKTLKLAEKIGKEEGLKYVHIGNV